MKQQIVIFLFFLSIFSASKAQDNIYHFAEEGTVWNVGSFSSAMYDPIEMIYLQMKGDTLINSTNYHIIWSLPCEIQGQNDTTLKLFTRVDNNLNQWLRTPSGEEHKIFNYGLELYDTFDGYAYWGNDHFMLMHFIVVEVGSEVLFGETRKYWGLGNEDHSEPITWWIEGVGPTESLLSANLFHTPICGWHAELLCAWNNAVQIFDNQNFPYCEYFPPFYNDRISLFATNRTEFTVLTNDSLDNIISCNWIKLYGDVSGYMPDYPPPDNYPHLLWIDDVNFSSPAAADLFIKAWEDSLLYYGPYGNMNNLIFDFKATLGDTLNISAYNYSMDTFVEITAYVTETGVFNTEGVDRKYWEISNENGSTQWINGLGNSEGILNPNWNLTGIDTVENYLLCAWLNDVQIYNNSEFDSCLYFVFNPNDTIPSEPEDTTNTNFGIYPNPFTNTFTVCQIEGNYTVKVYNSFGAKILHLESDEPECPINLSGFNSGVYYLRIITEVGATTTKIVKI